MSEAKARLISEYEPGLRNSDCATARNQIAIRGLVQGVGFRPFVYRLAQAFNLAGYVVNTSEGVRVEVEGRSAALATFITRLSRDAPPLARIEQVTVGDLEPVGETGFAIRQSTQNTRHLALVPPDVATCAACRRELADVGDRRYAYPFTNCTNCGPRYSIIRDIPYDRPMTTMSAFQMCETCDLEYRNPANRRYHAEPNACADCGPTLALVDVEPDTPIEVPDFIAGTLSLPILRAVRDSLQRGNIIAIKGLGGFHLACDAENDHAVRRLRKRKRGTDKAFALMAPNLATVERFCMVSDADRKALVSPRRPIVILPARAGTGISSAVAPGNLTLGVMLPYTPLHHLLFGDTENNPAGFRALVMTSGNLSEEPIVTHNTDVNSLHSIADRVLLHDRDIHMRVDDSIVRTFEGQERVLRRARSYAPDPLDVGMDLGETLACGPELKNTFCLTKGPYAFLSQHIGDLKNYETLVFFEETLERMKHLLRVRPDVVAHDLHPLYLSTRVAQGFSGVETVGVQHHHAHIASCMAENHLREKVIGVAFDGTGYGTDAAIWGGEFLVADFAGFERRAHLRYVPLPGGDMAIREPWRMALSYLTDTFGSEAEFTDLPFARAIPANKQELVRAMISRGVGTVRTSSCGRLFDAVASVIGVRHESTFEGQAAIELENIAAFGFADAYPFSIEGNDPWQIDMRPTMESLVREIRLGEETAHIATKFHNTLATVIVDVCHRLREREKLNRVCLSGGTFQNMLLLERAVAGLAGSGFEVFLHASVPPNDGGISLGQAMIAGHTMRRGG